MANGGNASQAYRASYGRAEAPAKAIWERASRLAANPTVRARIAELRDAAAREAVLEEADVLREAGRIAFSDIGAVLTDDWSPRPLKELAPGVRAAIAAVEKTSRTTKDGDVIVKTSVRLWDKNAALEKLMKHLGSFERDNRQRPGLFDNVPKSVLDMIVEKLRELERRARADGVH